MLIVYSRNGVPIRLTEERWHHITQRHPEINGQQEQVLDTLREPDMIQQGDFGELLAIRYYASTSLTGKFVVVAYREIDPQDGFVMRRPANSRSEGSSLRSTHRAAAEAVSPSSAEALKLMNCDRSAD